MNMYPSCNQELAPNNTRVGRSVSFFGKEASFQVRTVKSLGSVKLADLSPNKHVQKHSATDGTTMDLNIGATRVWLWRMIPGRVSGQCSHS